MKFKIKNSPEQSPAGKPRSTTSWLGGRQASNGAGKLVTRQAKFKNGAGFTLLELLLTIAIFALISIGLSSLAYIFIAYSQLLPEGQLASEVARVHQFSLEEFKRGIRQAESIQLGYTVGSDTYTTGTTTVVLRLLARDNANNVLAGAFDYLIYYLATSTSPQKILKRVVADPNSQRKSAHFPINDLVESISFTYNNAVLTEATKITIDLTSKKISGNISKSFHNVIEASLR
jgi:prepilin-type N-terminal cleavage/methylation domain-containing protein